MVLAGKEYCGLDSPPPRVVERKTYGATLDTTGVIEPAGGEPTPLSSGVSLGALGWTTATNYGLTAVGAATGILAARLLGPTGRGELAAIQLWPLLLGSIATLGLPDAVVYYSSRGERTGEVVTTATILASAGVMVGAAAGWFALPYVLASQSAEVVAQGRIFLLMTLLLVTGLPINILRGQQRFGAWNTLRVIPPACWLGALLIAPAVGWRSSGDFYRIQLVITAILAVPFLWIGFGAAGPPRRYASGLVKPLFSYGVPSSLSTLPQTLNLRLDQLLLAGLVSSGELGHYVVAVTWGFAVTPALSALGSVMFPAVAADREQSSATIGRWVRPATAIAAASAIVLGVLAPIVLPRLFGVGFREAIPSAIVLGFAAAIAGCNSVLQDILRGLDVTRGVLASEAAGLVVTVVSLLVLLPAFGILGAAISSVIGYGTVLIVAAGFVCRAAPMTPGELFRPRRADGVRVFRALRRRLRRPLKARG